MPFYLSAVYRRQPVILPTQCCGCTNQFCSHVHHYCGGGELKARAGWAAGESPWVLGQRKVASLSRVFAAWCSGHSSHQNIYCNPFPSNLHCSPTSAGGRPASQHPSLLHPSSSRVGQLPAPQTAGPQGTQAGAAIIWKKAGMFPNTSPFSST